MKIIDLSHRKPKRCRWCGCETKIVEKMWDWLCKDCKRCWPKLLRGQMYLKVWEDDK